MNYSEVKSKLNEMKVYSTPVFMSDGNKIPGYQVIKRVSNQEPVKILSEKYSIYQHINAFDNVVSKLEKTGLNYEIKNLITNETQGRNTIQVSFGFPEIAWDVDGSKTTATLELINSTDGSTKYSELFGMFRLVCSNGVVIGKELYRNQHKHSKFFFDYLESAEDFYAALDQYEELSKVIDKSRNVKASKRFMAMLIDAGFPMRLIKNLPEAYEKYKELNQETIQDYRTKWAYWAVLTNWLTHSVAATNIKRSIQLGQKLTHTMLVDTE